MTPKEINYFFPICGLTKYPNGTMKMRRYSKVKNTASCVGNTSKRGSVEKLSKQSLNRLAFTVKETKVKLMSMNTLTYSQVYPTTGKGVKKQLNRYVQMIKRKMGASTNYVWFMEFQRRGAPHFHILWSTQVTDQLRNYAAIWWANQVLKNGPDSEVQKMVRVHSHPTAWEAIRNEQGASRYVMKYATKPEQKIVPPEFSDVGRFWGASREVKNNIPDGIDIDTDQQEISEYFERTGHRAAKWEVIPKYIF